nr:MAG TPA: hypothetical protein [Caudoviricetes sp.]
MLSARKHFHTKYFGIAMQVDTHCRIRYNFLWLCYAGYGTGNDPPG